MIQLLTFLRKIFKKNKKESFILEAKIIRANGEVIDLGKISEGKVKFNIKKGGK